MEIAGRSERWRNLKTRNIGARRLVQWRDARLTGRRGIRRAAGKQHQGSEADRPRAHRGLLIKTPEFIRQPHKTTMICINAARGCRLDRAVAWHGALVKAGSRVAGTQDM
jgi:hypothetical protein